MITCRVKRVIFENYEGFSICEAEILDVDDADIPQNVDTKGIVIKGYFPRSKAAVLYVDGDWQLSSKFGYQLNVTSFSEELPCSMEGIIDYLTSTMPCVKQDTVLKIVNHFGLSTLDVLKNTPGKLLNVRGIGRKRIEKVVKSFQVNRSLQDVISYLVPLGVSPKKCIQVTNCFGGEAMAILQNAPFRLCEINGFGFKTVDQIARSSFFDVQDPLRIRGAIKYVFQNASNEGHLCLQQWEVVASAYLTLNDVDFLKEKIKKSIYLFLKNKNFQELTQHVKKNLVSIDKVINEFKRMAEDSTIKGDNHWVYLAPAYNQECETAEILAKRLRLPQKTFSEEVIRKEISKQEKRFGIKLAQKQIEAVIMGVNHRTCIITGGPGVGKTTVLKMVLKVCENLLCLSSSDVTLLAPTGRAAQRMCESVGEDYTASTIHSCLQIQEEGQSSFESIESEMVVVDESSMVDGYIGWCLLTATPLTSKLIIIGDAEQLPSVGAGNFLYELLSCKQIPSVRLDVIYRQSGTSNIVINSDLIRKGVTTLKYDETFQFVGVREKDEFSSNDKDKSKRIQQEASDIIVEQFLKAVKDKSLDEVQVLCPMRKEGIIAGATELNKRIQDKINPATSNKAEVKKGKSVFREGDKVILTKNNYDMKWVNSKGCFGEGLFNGDVGYIVKIDKLDDKVYIDFCGKKACLDLTQMGDIELAYAISIHKSQGSEYQTVIIPMLTSFSIMLKRNLVYTAITRAKKQVVIVGHQKALETAINTNVIAKRNTQLGKRIKEKMESIKVSI